VWVRKTTVKPSENKSGQVVQTHSRERVGDSALAGQVQEELPGIVRGVVLVGWVALLLDHSDALQPDLLLLPRCLHHLEAVKAAVRRGDGKRGRGWG
jgi:hypothetical protein